MSCSKIFVLPANILYNSLRQSPLLNIKPTTNVFVKAYAQNVRSALQTTAKRRTIKEILLAPAGEGAFSAGRGLLAGGAAVGLATLCYYGLGMSKEIGTIDRAFLWPQIVRERIKDTYAYFGTSLIFTAGSAFAIAKNPVLLNLFMKNSWLAIGATFIAVIGTGALCRSIPYSEGFGTKQITWMLHSAVIGGLIAPLSILGGPLLIKAAWYTAGIIGSLSMVAACAPSEKFLSMNGPLAIGLGAVFAASLGGMFLPPTTVLGAGLYSISIYGGLLLFSLFLLYDTQKIVKVAETYPTYAAIPYDPINASMGIYLDTINIFMRIAMILAHGGAGNRRK